MSARPHLIKIFTPSDAGEKNTNAQSLTVKEIVSRLPSEEFHVTMFYEGSPDPRIAGRPNTALFAYRKHVNTLRLLPRAILGKDIYFYPRVGPLDEAFFSVRKGLGLDVRVVTHIVMVMNEATGTGLIARSIMEGEAVFANSVYVGRTVEDMFGVQAGVIYNGIDRRFFFPAENAANTGESTKPVVLHAGSFQPRKRVELVIQEAARFPQASFRLVGRGETESVCRELVQSHGCRNVEFLGSLTPAQLGEEMRRADIFLFPSILEGHPQVLGQAAASGLPAIAMNVYHPEYVVHGETGFLVESDAELFQSLSQLIGDPARRRAMSAAAVVHSRKFEWDPIARQWAEAFRKVVAPI